MPPIIIRSENLDANESAFLSRQLEHILAGIYMQRYPQLKARMLFPVNNEAGPGVDSIVWRELDIRGMAEIIGNYATNLPRVDVLSKENRVPVRELGDAYGYSIFDIQKANRAGVPLDMYKGTAARRGIEQKIDALAFNGDATHGLVGLLNHPNIPKATVANNAGATSTTWANKTPDEILKDMNGLVNGIVKNTNEVEAPNTLLLPIDQYTLIATTPRSSTSDTTILEFFLKNSPYIRSVIPVAKLKGAGTSGVDIMVAYERSPEAVELHIPQEFTQLPPQERNLEFLVNCYASVAGLIIRKPMAFSIGEGI